MTADNLPPARQIITRTLTITTVETWSITIGPVADSEPAGAVVIDQDQAEAKSFQPEEET
jgi:hypothetical protein